MNLKKFLVKAKKSTYATEGEENERRLEDGAKELTYEEGEFKYRDRYYGFDPFGGEEVVWNNGKPVWTMEYRGRTTESKAPSKEIYKFLRKALREVKGDKPFRGPENFEKGQFKYTNRVKGDIKEFKGTERILYKGKKVYKLYYHGGEVDR